MYWFAQWGKLDTYFTSESLYSAEHSKHCEEALRWAKSANPPHPHCKGSSSQLKSWQNQTASVKSGLPMYHASSYMCCFCLKNYLLNVSHWRTWSYTLGRIHNYFELRFVSPWLLLSLESDCDSLETIGEWIGPALPTSSAPGETIQSPFPRFTVFSLHES